jgi:23S rRNA C2498 (ribose-2'-O)-methylase RlmM
MGLSIVVRCEWSRADRFLELLLEETGLEVRSSSSRKQVKRAGVTHGGFVWVRCAESLEAVVQSLRDRSSFDRFFTALFPTRHSLVLEPPEGCSAASAEDTAAALVGAFRAAFPSPVREVRLHVIDTDSKEKDRELNGALGAALCANGEHELSPVSFEGVFVVVRCGGEVEWDFISPAQYALIKQNSQHGEAHQDANTSIGKKVCRASHKLIGALELLAQRKRPIDFTLPALDVGSAPGGWTEALLDHGCAKVVAIDPADMSEDLMASPEYGHRVTHMQLPAQEAATQLVGQSGVLYSALVCDVNADGRWTVTNLLAPLVPLLAPGESGVSIASSL